MFRNAARFIACALLVVVPVSVQAKDNWYDLPAKDALESEDAGKVLDIPVYLMGQEHPAVKQDLGEYTSNKRTNAFNKPNERACNIAFLSAIIALQGRARSLSADAVVDIKSITKHNDLESDTDFRCLAGRAVANVVLTGRMVKFEKEAAPAEAEEKQDE